MDKRLLRRQFDVTPFELQTLTGLPCGCVVADFRSTTLDVELVSIEAKGPHCQLDSHRRTECSGWACVVNWIRSRWTIFVRLRWLRDVSSAPQEASIG